MLHDVFFEQHRCPDARKTIESFHQKPPLQERSNPIKNNERLTQMQWKRDVRCEKKDTKQIKRRRRCEKKKKKMWNKEQDMKRRRRCETRGRCEKKEEEDVKQEEEDVKRRERGCEKEEEEDVTRRRRFETKKKMRKKEEDVKEDMKRRRRKMWKQEEEQEEEQGLHLVWLGGCLAQHIQQHDGLGRDERLICRRREMNRGKKLRQKNIQRFLANQTDLRKKSLSNHLRLRTETWEMYKQHFVLFVSLFLCFFVVLLVFFFSYLHQANTQQTKRILLVELCLFPAFPRPSNICLRKIWCSRLPRRRAEACAWKAQSRCEQPRYRPFCVNKDEQNKMNKRKMRKMWKEDVKNKDVKNKDVKRRFEKQRCAKQKMWKQRCQRTKDVTTKEVTLSRFKQHEIHIWANFRRRGASMTLSDSDQGLSSERDEKERKEKKRKEMYDSSTF
jgi:hypothetical protein